MLLSPRKTNNDYEPSYQVPEPGHYLKKKKKTIKAGLHETATGSQGWDKDSL